MSPAAADSMSTRLRPSNANSFVTFVLTSEPSSFATAIASLTLTRPLKMRPMAMRPT
jgi:hypothetical protein